MIVKTYIPFHLQINNFVAEGATKGKKVSCILTIALVIGAFFFFLAILSVARNISDFSTWFFSYLWDWYDAIPRDKSKEEDTAIRRIRKSFFLFFIGVAFTVTSIPIRYAELENSENSAVENVVICIGGTAAFLLFFPILFKLCREFMRWFWHKCMD